ncbi:DUF6232 family protein [Embleya sp. NPDC001921]
MTDAYRPVQVRIEAGALWVGGDAYPLRNISHVGQRSLPPVRRNGSAARDALTSKIKMVAIVGGILTVVTVGVALVPTAVILVLLHRRRANLRDLPDLPALHGLIINTAGTQRDAVWSTARHEIDYLVQEITTAIGKPDGRRLTYVVQHAVAGDYIQQSGANSVGKANHFGSGNISAG